MRIELVNGRYLVCGGILPSNQVQEGQDWASADGSKHTVKVIARDGDWVTYSGETQPAHTKDVFSFQSRYCLVLDPLNLPPIGRNSVLDALRKDAKLNFLAPTTKTAPSEKIY